MTKKYCDICDKSMDEDEVSHIWPMGIETYACEKCTTPPKGGF